MNKFIALFLFVFLSNPLFGQRHVILIIADDLGPDYLGFYPNHEDTAHIPFLRSLLNKAVLFTDATVNPYCSATRATYFTGRYAFRTGVGAVVGGGRGSGSLDTSEFALPELIEYTGQDIVRGHVGKWHLHNPMPQSNLQMPQKFGIQHFEGPFIGALPSYTNWTKYTNGISSTVTNYATTENVNNAVEWLKKNLGKQQFLWLAFNAPHSPYHLPPAELHSNNSLTGTPVDIRRNPKAYFKAMVEAMDSELKRFCDSLKRLNLFDSTHFVFVGDNGNSKLVSQITDTAHSKGTIYEYGVHVPLFISGPSVIKPGRISTALVNGVDLYATIADLLELKNWREKQPAARPIDAKSLLPILENKTTSVRDWSFTELIQTNPDSTDGKAIKNLKYRLLRFDSGKEEFYDLSNDRNEAINLLKSPLNNEQNTNYLYLCTEMNRLLTQNTDCNKFARTTAVKTSTAMAFPNPFNDILQISTKDQFARYCIYNASGIVVYEGFSRRIDTRNWPAGIYILKTGAQSTCKLLKYLP